MALLACHRITLRFDHVEHRRLASRGHHGEHGCARLLDGEVVGSAPIGSFRVLNGFC
jgi:hypothetical protein